MQKKEEEQAAQNITAGCSSQWAHMLGGGREGGREGGEVNEKE
jgi:hypothetical protein